MCFIFQELFIYLFIWLCIIFLLCWILNLLQFQLLSCDQQWSQWLATDSQPLASVLLRAAITHSMARGSCDKILYCVSYFEFTYNWDTFMFWRHKIWNVNICHFRSRMTCSDCGAWLKRTCLTRLMRTVSLTNDYRSYAINQAIYIFHTLHWEFMASLYIQLVITHVSAR